jgi:hypothetical protein
MARPYLIQDRLEDVILLVQYLGLGKAYAIEKDTKIDGALSPRSAGTGEGWAVVGKDHPEFFSVTKAGTTRLALRLFLSEGGKPDKIELSDVQQLIKNALEIHERQFKVDCDANNQRVQKWRDVREWLTMIGAMIAGTAGIVQLMRNLH